MALSANVTCNIDANQTKSIGPSDNTASLRVGKTNGFKNAYASTSDNTVYSSSNAIAASGSLSIDLAGSLTDLYGDAAVFSSVYSVLIVNHSGSPIGGQTATTADIAITGNFLTTAFGASSSWPLKATSGKYSKLLFDEPAGISITASTADTITITNSSATAIAYVDVIIVGAVAS